jgi:hypothetical protein
MRKLLAGMLCAAAACGGGGDDGNGQQTVATPAFSPAGGTYSAPQSVTVTCATAGATIRYTTDGTTPTASSPAYSGPIAVSTTGTTLKAMATLAGQIDSAVASATYVLQAAAPVFSPPAGTYATAQSVAITSATPGAVIRYTTDGTAPTASSPAYSAPVEVAATTTIRAVATRGGFADSAAVSSTYTIDAGATPAATPTFSPAAGTYTSAQNVTISTTTPGATLHYTDDGTTPTTASPTYAGPVAVAATTTLKAIAVAAGFTQSAVATAIYTISAGGTDFDTLCQAVETKMLDLLASCLKANPAVLAAGGLFDRTIECAETARDISAGLVVYDPVAGAACEAAFQAYDCDSLLAGGEFSMPAACEQALQGQVGNGGTCYRDEDCATGYCTADWTSTCPGTCQPLVTQGGNCSSAPCAAGLTCAGSNTCAAAAGLGGPCPCQDAYWCDDSGGAPGICSARRTAGGACLVGDECAVGTVCVGSAPPSTPGTCQTLVGESGNCAASESLCGLGYQCPGGTCVSWPALGEACGDTTPFCVGGYCDLLAANPTCLAYRADGQSCNATYFGMDCASGSCVGGTCAASVCRVP